MRVTEEESTPSCSVLSVYSISANQHSVSAQSNRCLRSTVTSPSHHLHLVPLRSALETTSGRKRTLLSLSHWLREARTTKLYKLARHTDRSTQSRMPCRPHHATFIQSTDASSAHRTLLLPKQARDVWRHCPGETLPLSLPVCPTTDLSSQFWSQNRRSMDVAHGRLAVFGLSAQRHSPAHTISRKGNRMTDVPILGLI